MKINMLNKINTTVPQFEIATKCKCKRISDKRVPSDEVMKSTKLSY